MSFFWSTLDLLSAVPASSMLLHLLRFFVYVIKEEIWLVVVAFKNYHMVYPKREYYPV